MARQSSSTVTRIATTINARFNPASGATDTFYLDGRLAGRREHRAADITLDREDSGFFFSVFAHLASNGPDEVATTRVRNALGKVLQNVKQNSHNIDNEINELAECAVDVAGRITLHHDGVRQPYFAGIVVKESELAAITMGNGCAYLYRNDILYPLTADDYAMEPIDFYGKSVPKFKEYCAGVAGTVRYSNIARLQPDDCLIVCNKDVMDALGQREVLRLLYEAEDQSDAAGLIITAAAAKMPGVPMQFMISFVEQVIVAERTGRLPFNRGQLENTGAAAVAARSGQTGGRSSSVAASGPDASGNMADVASYGHAGVSRQTEPQGGMDQVVPPVTDYDASDYTDEQDGEEDYVGHEQPGRGRRLAFYLILAAICIACVFAIYNMLSNKDDDTKTTTTVAGQLTPGQTTLDGGTTVTSDPALTPDPAGTTTTAPGETTPTTTVATTTTAAGVTVQLPTTHTVVSGDALFSIAKKYYGTATQDLVDLIKQANNLTSDNLQVGQVLQIPVKP